MENKYIEDIKENLAGLDSTGSAYNTQSRVQNILNNLKELIKDDAYKATANKVFVELELFHSKDIEKNNSKFDDSRKAKASQAIKNEATSLHSYTVDRISQITSPILQMD